MSIVAMPDDEDTDVQTPRTRKRAGREATTTDGKPPAPGLEHAAAPQPAGPDGQHGAYWVLTPEELAKGFVRPLRRSYVHDKCGTVTSMGTQIAATYAAQPDYYGSTFCVCCGAHFKVGADGEFRWADADGKPTSERVGT